MSSGCMCHKMWGVLITRMPMRMAEVIGKALDDAGMAGKKPDYLALRYLMPEKRKIVLSALESNADRTIRCPMSNITARMIF